MEDRDWLNQIQREEDRYHAYGKKLEESENIREAFARSYRQQEEVLQEILFFSKGTETERSAHYELEALAEEQTRDSQHFTHGQEELTERKKEARQRQEELEEAYALHKKKEKEGEEKREV